MPWVLWGYSGAFGPDVHGLISNLDWVGLNHVGLAPNPDYAATVPQRAYMVIQMMFAGSTPVLITGTFAERKRFKAFVIFSLGWATLVYDLIAHRVWGTSGWLHQLGALAFWRHCRAYRFRGFGVGGGDDVRQTTRGWAGGHGPA